MVVGRKKRIHPLWTGFPRPGAVRNWCANHCYPSSDRCHQRNRPSH